MGPGTCSALWSGLNTQGHSDLWLNSSVLIICFHAMSIILNVNPSNPSPNFSALLQEVCFPLGEGWQVLGLNTRPWAGWAHILWMLVSKPLQSVIDAKVKVFCNKKQSQELLALWLYLTLDKMIWIRSLDCCHLVWHLCNTALSLCPLCAKPIKVSLRFSGHHCHQVSTKLDV